MKWQLLRRETLYEGFLRLARLHIAHARFQGGEDLQIERELIQRGHAAVVLPYDPVRDTVVLVEQFRVGALDSPQGPWLIEAIAGLIEPGEAPAEVARREAWEEAGCALDELVHAFDYMPSPGSCDERVSLFIARAATEALGGHFGVTEEGEDIRVHVLPADEAFSLVRDGVIESVNALLALQWLQLNRTAIRERWGGEPDDPALLW